MIKMGLFDNNTQPGNSRKSRFALCCPSEHRDESFCFSLFGSPCRSISESEGIFIVHDPVISAALSLFTVCQVNLMIPL